MKRKWRVKLIYRLRRKERCNKMINEQVNLICNNIEHGDYSLNEYLSNMISHIDRSILTNIFFLNAVTYRIKNLIGEQDEKQINQMIEDHYYERLICA